MNDFEAPERTEDAFRLLDSARSYRQMAAEYDATVPAAAAFFQHEAERREVAVSGFLELSEKPAVGTGRELTIPREEMGDLWGLKETLDHPGRETVAGSPGRSSVSSSCSSSTPSITPERRPSQPSPRSSFQGPLQTLIIAVEPLPGCAYK
jgi:hypothetical protein